MPFKVLDISLVEGLLRPTKSQSNINAARNGIKVYMNGKDVPEHKKCEACKSPCSKKIFPTCRVWIEGTGRKNKDPTKPSFYCANVCAKGQYTHYKNLWKNGEPTPEELIDVPEEQ